jgi:hypothetical protein
MIEISEVIRVDGKVEKVVVTLDGFLVVTFQRIGGKIKEISRIDHSSTRDNPAKRGIPPEIYNQMMRQVRAIFKK